MGAGLAGALPVNSKRLTPSFLDCILAPGFFKCQGQALLVFSVKLVFNQSAVKPAGLDRFFP
jgi:hypothetical protein